MTTRSPTGAAAVEFLSGGRHLGLDTICTRSPTAEEVAELRAMIESDIREIIATKQPG